MAAPGEDLYQGTVSGLLGWVVMTAIHTGIFDLRRRAWSGRGDELRLLNRSSFWHMACHCLMRMGP